MRPNVEHIFPQYSEQFEGRFASPYVDVRGLVTCATGILIDPIDRAYRFEWMIGERRATVEEIRDDWSALKSRKDELSNVIAAKQAAYTSIRLTPDAIDAIVLNQLHANVAYMKRHMSPWDTFPADAQLGLASLAWALGAGLEQTRPELVAAANAGDWLVVKAHARLRESNNKGVIGRNKAQELCFSNAQTVKDRGLDPAALWWPNVAPKEDSLHTLAVKALELGLAHESTRPKS